MVGFIGGRWKEGWDGFCGTTYGKRLEVRRGKTGVRFFSSHSEFALDLFLA
jgi:hypothetical protein